MPDMNAWWQETRADYLSQLKVKLVEVNAHDSGRLVASGTGNFMTQTYARLLRAKELPAAKDLTALICDALDVLNYEVPEGMVNLPEGIFVLYRGEIKCFIDCFSRSIRLCHRDYGRQFVLYVRHLNLADCYRPQRDDEPLAEYDRAWLAGWTRFIELADSYAEYAASQRVIEMFERVASK